MAARRAWRRRDTVLGGLVAATTVAAGPRALAQPSSALALPAGDVLVLERALELEQTLAVAYESAAGGELLEPEVREAAELFVDQEREHADALTAALVDLGGTASAPPSPEEIEGLVGLGSQADLLEFLAGLERDAIALYGAAATELTAPDLLKTAAQIVGNEAQHLVVLHQQLGEEAVPAVFGVGAAADRSGPLDR
jgi:rubrerythrin